MQLSCFPPEDLLRSLISLLYQSDTARYSAVKLIADPNQLRAKSIGPPEKLSQQTWYDQEMFNL